LKRHSFIGCFACVLSLATWSHGQAVPTASRAGGIQVGIGGFAVDPDYAQKYIQGLTFYGDFDFMQHIGAEAEIHYSVNTPTDVSEDSYLAGVRYYGRHKKFTGYAKFLAGVGRFGYQSGSFVNPASATYFEYALGGGVEYLATRHINVRVIDFEAQKWPGFPTNGLSPYSYSAGVAYVFH
jgi:outer membrane protein with beta-barrel domain